VIGKNLRVFDNPGSQIVQRTMIRTAVSQILENELRKTSVVAFFPLLDCCSP
jgi:hypothetical protein